ncbi:MAG: SRPBCC family protein [Chitinophagales bacterium]
MVDIDFQHHCFGFFLIGFTLPERILVESKTEINRSPEDVLDFLDNLRNWEKWSEINAQNDSTLKVEYSGTSAGVGSIMTWERKALGKGSIKITRITQMPVLHYILEPESSNLLFDCKFEIRKTEQPGKSNVRWVVVTDLGLNPVMRYAGILLKSSLKSETEKEIEKLKAVLEE